jgi:hypothetical protein
MNICNQYICNHACYKIDANTLKELCKYGFLQFLVNETHFNIETKLLHIKRIDEWLNNVNHGYYQLQDVITI